MNIINISRYMAIVIKEFRHMARDKFTVIMVVGIPLLQVILFGFAINFNPKHLPTVIITNDQSEQVSTLISSISNTKRFKILKSVPLSGAKKLLLQGKIEFIIEIPSDFTKKLIRNEHPDILLYVDGVDSSAAGSGASTLNHLINSALNDNLTHNGLNYLKNRKPPFNLIIHNHFNPEQKTEQSIVPGLAGIILTLILIMVTGLAITRERENGTMESLLATPVKPLEVILGKITPYICVGYAQLTLILIFGFTLFHIHPVGSITLLLILTFPFIMANLIVGITFSTIAKNQLQAMQMTFFFFLPSILLSGFMFPFYGMPIWAQYIGNILPITHYLRIIRGIILKGNNFFILWSSIWPILVFILIVGTICIKRYKKTL